MWHHGTPNIGEPPAPLLEASAERGIRWLGFDRPGYGGSKAVDRRMVADAADLAARVAGVMWVALFWIVTEACVLGGAWLVLGRVVSG